MPETPGHIELKAGVCPACAKQGLKLSGAGEQPGRGMAELRRDIEDARRRNTGAYDCLVALSGGKDSTMALRVAVKDLGLRPLAVFVDNGFCVEAMYRNVTRAADGLGVDLLVFKPRMVQDLFRHLLAVGARVYFCRICNGLVDYYIRTAALQHGIGLVISGHTKGQEFLKGTELFWIYKASDSALLDAVRGMAEFALPAEMFASYAMFFHRRFGSLSLISPFHYLEYAEEGILATISAELGYALPETSWPAGSTNCLFNFVSQKLALEWFGYSQHEAELSGLVRRGEMTRERALEIIQTPIAPCDLAAALGRIGLDDSVCTGLG